MSWVRGYELLKQWLVICSTCRIIQRQRRGRTSIDVISNSFSIYTVEFQDFAATPIRMLKCACAVWFAHTVMRIKLYVLLPSSKKGGKEKTRIMEKVDTSGCYVRDEDCPDTINECFARVDAGCGVSIKPYNLQLTNLPASDRTYLAVLPACW